jgi:hypothetical protein
VSARRRLPLAVALGLALGAAAPPAHAQPEPDRPETPYEDGEAPEAGLPEPGPDGGDGVDEDLMQRLEQALRDKSQAERVDLETATRRAAEARAPELERLTYQFCRDDDFDRDKAPGVLRFCRMIDDETLAVCPQAAALCRPVSESWFELADLALPEWVAWGIIALLGLALVVAFVQALRKNAWDDGERFDFGDAEPAPDLAELTTLPEAPSSVILRRARAALAEGRAEEAAVFLHLACLRFLDDTGLARFHPSRTNNDYLRAIRRQRPLAALYRGVARETDRLRFDDGRVDAASVQALLQSAELELARPIAPAPVDGADEASEGPSEGLPGDGLEDTDDDPRRATAALPPPGLGLVLALALTPLGFGASGCGSVGSSFADHGPLGLSALPRLVEAAGIPTEVRRQASLDEIPAEVGAIVFLTEERLPLRSKLELDALLDRDLSLFALDDAGVSRVLLPLETSSVSDRVNGRHTPAIDVALGPPSTCYPTLAGLDMMLGAEATARVPVGRHLSLEVGDPKARSSEWVWVSEPLLVEAGWPDHVLAWAGHRVDEGGMPKPGCLVVFAGADLVRNLALTREANVRLAIALLAGALDTEGPQRKVLFVDRLGPSGDGAGTPPPAAPSGRLAPLFGHGLVWLVALLVFLGASFGPLRDPAVTEHKAFVEHVEAIGRHYASAGPSGHAHAARSLARWLVLRHAGEARGAQGWAAVAAHLADRHDQPLERVEAALRLGLDTETEPRPIDAELLRTLSILLSTPDKR